MSFPAQGNQAHRGRWFSSEPLQFVLGAVLVLLLVWLAVDLMSRLAGHQGGAWLYGLEGITLPLLAVAAVVLMWQSRTESAARRQEGGHTQTSRRVTDGGTGLGHPPADRHAKHASAGSASHDGGSFPVRHRRY
jgi:hypothetical protein